MKKIRLSDTYFNMIDVDGELFTFYDFHNWYNINELIANKRYNIELDDHSVKELIRINFEEYNNAELKTINRIFNHHILYSDESIWDMFVTEIENNNLSYDLITQYIQLYPEKKEYLEKVLGDLHYYHEKKV